MRRRAWIIAGRAFGKGLLGPAIRIVEMARHAAMEGHEVHVVVLDPEVNPLSVGVQLHDLRSMDFSAIGKGDAVVLSPYLPARVAWKFLRSDIPFHLDLYCVTATEQMALWARTPGRARDVERAKLRKRYLIHAMAAESIYVSCMEQWLVVAGMFLSERDWSKGGLADSLTRKVVEVPMGVRDEPFPEGSPSPYPEHLRHRPIFLWGGSLWNWFDLPTLIESFRILRQQNSDAALFFLSGGNRTERASEDDPIRVVRERAQELGLLGENIFFNDVVVGPSQLAPWLDHCRAGILTNPDSLESLSSWRTRYLDLLWAGRPLVVSGKDPLAERMRRAGAALLVPAENPKALAEALSSLASDQGLSRSMGAESRKLGHEMSWKKSLSPFLSALQSENSFKEVGIRPSMADAFGYLTA